jgi:hypothetical protein
MGIAPISAVRAVSMIAPSPEGPDPSPIVEVEHLGQSGEDQYTPADRTVRRGLEDEEEEALLVTNLDPPKDTDAPPGNVSLFA